MSGQSPPQAQFGVQVRVLPVQQLLNLVSGPLGQADDRPHGAAQGATAAQAAAEQPPHVDWEGLAQGDVYPGEGGLVLLWSDTGVQGGGEVAVKTVGQAEAGRKNVGKTGVRYKTTKCWHMRQPNQYHRCEFIITLVIHKN